MIRSAQAWLFMTVAGIGTYAIRASFLLWAHRLGEVSESTRDALRMIPPAALAALAAPALLRPDGALDPLDPRALAGMVAVAVAWLTRSVLATVVVGLSVAALLQGLW